MRTLGVMFMLYGVLLSPDLMSTTQHIVQGVFRLILGG